MRITRVFSNGTTEVFEVTKVTVTNEGMTFDVLTDYPEENQIILEVPISNDLYKKMLQSFLEKQIK